MIPLKVGSPIQLSPIDYWCTTRSGIPSLRTERSQASVQHRSSIHARVSTSHPPPHTPSSHLSRRKPLKFDTSALDILQRKWRDKDSLLEEDLKPKLPPLPKKLPPPDESSVSTLLEKRGTIAKYARESVDDKDIIRLRPGQWLNDEIINFYGAMLLGRSEANKENIPNGPARRGKPLNVHYFSSFFWSKLTGEGYDKGRLAKWTKKVLLRQPFHNIHLTLVFRSISFRKIWFLFRWIIIMPIGRLLLSIFVVNE